MHRPHVNRARTVFLLILAANVGLFAYLCAIDFRLDSLRPDER